MDWKNFNSPQDGGRGDWGQQMPPSISETLNKVRQVFKGRGPSVWIIVAIIFVLWLLTGIYIVAPDEKGVVLRFGKFVYETGPGPHWHLPIPIESVLKPKVTQVRRIEIGFRTVRVYPKPRYKAVLAESRMLTGDENIVNIEFIVQYLIKNARDYLFNVRDQSKTVKDAAEAAMREVIGKNSIDDALTTGKFKIQKDTQQLLQQILDSYKAGIQIKTIQLQDVHPPTEVMHAFKDVASAKEDKNKFINDAYGYRNDLIPKAKGRAAEILNEAMSYKATKIKKAQGDTTRFLKLLSEYEKAKDVTKKRLYIETMQDILPEMDKVIVDTSIGERSYPLLPLSSFQKSTPKP
ncbi:MAG: FtsH protease activity modulator HflK [Deltaproteobacteria bacterium]|nr:FtsH protease activity modulator HflK [Deltaproteobacteria bacterium]